MPSTYSLRFKYELPATGELSGLWGNTVNASITNLLDETINAVSTIAMANANQTLTIPNGLTSPNRARTLNCTGAHTAIRTLTVPSGDGTFRVINGTTGGFNLNVKTPTSGSIAVPPGFEGYFIAQGTGLTLSSPLFNALFANSAAITSLSASFTDGTAGTPAMNFAADTDTGIYRVGANSLGFSTGGVNRASLSTTLLASSVNMSIANSAPTLSLDCAAGQSRAIYGLTGGLNRWAIFPGTNAAETGSDAGSAFLIQAFNDAGSGARNVFQINRATSDTGIGNTATAGVKLTLGTLVSEGFVDARSLRLVNLNSSANSSSSIEIATGAGVLRGQIKGVREASTNNGSLVLSSSLSGAAVDVLTLASGGGGTFSGSCSAVSFITTSDARMKEGIQPFDLGLDAVLSLEPSTFRFKNSAKGQRHVGLIAQDVQKTDLGPHAVHSEPDGTLSLEPHVVIYALVNAVKELHAEVRRLKGYP